jgi:WD40 repeat protein
MEPNPTANSASPTPEAGHSASPSALPTATKNPASGTFAPTGSLVRPRWYHTATLLADGRVLVTGGERGDISQVSYTAEVYDPAAGKFTATSSMMRPREGHTATLLGNGRVLIAGGDEGGSAVDASAELYDPTTGKFAFTGSMGVARTGHTATLLRDGRVLIAGGDTHATAELYDPSTGKFKPTGSMKRGRLNAGAVLLPDGRVLVAGGEGGSSGELYDPSTGEFALTGSTADGHYGAAVALLSDGRVLVATGYAFCPGMHPVPSDEICIDVPLDSAEVYDPATGKFNPTGPMGVGRGAAGAPWSVPAVLLPDGRVLVVGGGLHSGEVLNSAELYDPATGTFISTGSMGTARFGFTTTLLRDGRVLVAGGYSDIGGGTTVSSAEIYQP